MRNLRPISTSKRVGLALACTLFLSTALLPATSHAADTNLPPYEQSLRRLSAVVGALMYLDPLCNKSNARDWYNQMASLLEAEEADDARRRQLTDRFNRYYRSYARTYKQCNPQAEKIIKLYHSEGQSLLTQLKLKHAR